ncbi:MAG: patatin-like phospholipase family protein, partial [Bacteroidales bacterium]
MKRIFVLLFFTVTCLQMLPQRVGLVLSGGGARGIAHIGLIQALEDNNIPIDYIAGTSMGAVVGSLYAMGYSTEEMVALIKSDEFKLWQAGKIDDNMINYFKVQEPTPSLFSVKTSFTDSVKVRKFLPQSLINPLPMNFAFMKLYSHATARSNQNFNNLFVPFRAVASDVYNKRPVILRDGNLGDAVRASMTFPFVFKPIKINGVLVYDGGIYNNYPVDVMKEDFAPDFIIGSVVSDNPAKPEEDDLMGQIDNMVMQKTNYEIDSIDGISIKFKLENVSLLDMHKVSEIYQIGYDKGLEFMAQIKNRVTRRITKEEVALNRISYRAKDPTISFDHVQISGVNQLQRSYLKEQFPHEKGEKLTMEDAEKAYFGLLSDSKITEIMPSVEPNDKGGFDLKLQVKLNQDLETSIGGLVTSMNANRIFLGLNYRILSGFAADMGVNAQLGKAYNTINGNVRFYMPTRLPLYMDARYAYIGQKYYESDKLFSMEDSPCFIDQRENYGVLSFGMPLGRLGKMVYGGGYGSLLDGYYQSKQIDFSKYRPDNSRYKLWKIYALLDLNRITARDFPLEGFRHLFKISMFGGKDMYTPSSLREENAPQPEKSEKAKLWFQAKYENESYLKLAKKFVLGLSGNLMISNKPFFSNYTATIIQAPAFTPTLHSQTVFNEAFRANNFIAVGVKPIWKINDLFHLRSEFYAFQPFRKIVPGENNIAKYAPFKIKPEYIGEISAVVKLPFASISAFVNHYSSPKNEWNFGLNIGFLI